jgi:uncharacterized membrane protein YfcA
MVSHFWLGVLGLIIGAVSGLAGIGGGIFLIPALVMLYGFTQHQAVGTTLAVMVPPVTLFAAVEYYRRGHVDLKVTLVLTVAILLGSWGTARFAHHVPEIWLKRLFGALLLLISARFLTMR